MMSRSPGGQANFRLPTVEHRQVEYPAGHAHRWVASQYFQPGQAGQGALEEDVALSARGRLGDEQHAR